MGSIRACALALAAAAVAAALCAAVPATAAVPGENVIQNPQFSSSLMGWTPVSVSQGSYSGYPHLRVISEAKCEPAQSGNPFLEIDVPGNADGYVAQQLAVPASPSPLTFRTWGNLEPVQVRIEVVTPDHAVHTVLAYTPAPLQASPALNSCSGAKPVTESIDMMPFKGQAVELRIEATASGHDGTIADFDDFALIGAAAAVPTRRCVVPRLAGVSLAKAERALKKAGCRVAGVHRRRSSSVPKGKVVSTSPRAGAKKPRGSGVVVTVSRGR